MKRTRNLTRAQITVLECLKNKTQRIYIFVGTDKGHSYNSSLNHHYGDVYMTLTIRSLLKKRLVRERLSDIYGDDAIGTVELNGDLERLFEPTTMFRSLKLRTEWKFKGGL